MKLNRILVAVNARNSRDAAVERAFALAQSSKAELHVVHAVPVNERFSFRAAERLKRMTELRERAADYGVRLQTVEQQGHPPAIIELHASTRAVDLIVIGSEARRGWGARSLVAERVIRRTSVPTLVVAGGGSSVPSPFRRVLVAVDLSPVSKDVLTAAVAMTADEAEQLTVMHTVKGLEAAGAVRSLARWMVPEYRRHMLEDARRSLDAIVSAVPATAGSRVEVFPGSPEGTILDEATEMNADLVVVGRSRGFKLLGSTAVRVLRRNRRALLVVPSEALRTKRVEWELAA